MTDTTVSVQHLCYCGCGQQTPIATRNRKELGWIKGQPLKYAVGHNPRWRGGPAVAPGEKWCGGCRKVKPKTDFFANKQARCGLQGVCKPCSRKRTNEYRSKNRDRTNGHSLRCRLNKLGVSLSTYQSLLKAQKGKCAVCRQSETSRFRGTLRTLSVDHDHKTGKVRGLLCSSCNTALGLFHDSPKLLLKAIEYLERGRR